MLDARFWDEYMLRYDTAIATLQPYRDMIERCVVWGRVQPGQHIVDLGCGTGNLLAHVADELGAAAKLTGVERCGVARELAATKLVDARARLLAADLDDDAALERLTAVDVCFLVNVLYDLREPIALLRKLGARMCKGGRLIVCNPHTPRPHALLAAHAAWREQASDAQRSADDRCEPARAWMLDANLEIASLARDRRVHFLGAGQLRTLLARAGFVITRLQADAYAGLNLLVEAVKVG